jgi:hypothetical protein
MKYEIITCSQCGNEFKRTNKRQTYCSGACRVSAHRDRHGYEQPIFKYPIIRAIERIKNLDIDVLYQAKLFAVHYLREWQKKGRPLPNKKDIELLRITVQLGTASEDANLNERMKTIEPLSELILLVQNIQNEIKLSEEKQNV